MSDKPIAAEAPILIPGPVRLTWRDVSGSLGLYAGNQVTGYVGNDGRPDGPWFGDRVETGYHQSVGHFRTREAASAALVEAVTRALVGEGGEGG